MRAVVADGVGGVSLCDWDDPIAGAREVLVAPLLVGVCGTDLELTDATIDPAYARYPLVLGHEWVGELVEAGPVGPAGARVVVEGIVACGECAACRRGDTNLCAVYDEVGFTRPGALAELVAVPAGLVHRLDDGVALEDAVLVEPMAVVWRALTRRARPEGLRVAVVGDGTIALLSAHLARTLRPASVTVIGRRDAQAGLARDAGADRFARAGEPQGFDLVVEAAGTAESVAAALALVARGGAVVLLGLPPHGTLVPVAPDDLVNNDVVVEGSFSYTRAAFADVVARVNAREVRPSFLVTHRFSMAAFDRAVAELRAPSDDSAPRGKIVVDPRAVQP